MVMKLGMSDLVRERAFLFAVHYASSSASSPSSPASSPSSLPLPHPPLPLPHPPLPLPHPLPRKVGPVSVADDDKVSPAMQKVIDEEVKRILKVGSYGYSYLDHLVTSGLS